MPNSYIHFFLFILLLSVFSCNKMPNDGIPAYIDIDSVSMQTDMLTEGTALQDFNTLWVETEGENLGANEYPTKLPALVSGNRQIIISAGVKVAGDYYNREEYPAVKPYKTTLNFVPGEHINVTPMFEYYETNSYPLLEDFESGNLFDGYTRTDLTDANNIEGKCMHFHLSPTNNQISVKTSSPIVIPKNKRVYIEMHMKGNNDFGMGVETLNAATNISQFFDVFSPQEDEWTKIYYDITFLLSYLNATSFNFYLESIGDGENTTDVYIDNVKIIVIE